MSPIVGVGVGPSHRLASQRGAAAGAAPVEWGSLVADSSDSTLLAEQDSVVAAADGGSYLYAGKVGETWKLLWADRAGALLRGDELGTHPVTVASDGPPPFDIAYGIATDHLPGARTAGDTFTHEADAIIEWVQTTVPSAGFTNFWFRQSDANNAWIAQVNSAGNIALFEHVAGVSTLRGSVSGVVSNGHRIVVIADGEMIRGYSNNVLRWTYSSAANFKTETDGRLQSLGTGGAVSDVISWPRTLSGAAKSALDKVVAA